MPTTRNPCGCWTRPGGRPRPPRWPVSSPTNHANVTACSAPPKPIPAVCSTPRPAGGSPHPSGPASNVLDLRAARLDPPLVAVLDEAANVCPISDLPDLYSHLGSRGVVPVGVLQSVPQPRRHGRVARRVNHPALRTGPQRRPTARRPVPPCRRRRSGIRRLVGIPPPLHHLRVHPVATPAGHRHPTHRRGTPPWTTQWPSWSRRPRCASRRA